MGFYEKLWIGIAIIIFLILLGYFLAYDFFGVRTIIQRGVEGIKEKQKQAEIKANTIECPGEIIQDKFELYEGEGRYGERDWFKYRVNTDLWKDGIEISNRVDYPGEDCVQGSKEGENVNYFYCNDLHYNKKTTEINDEGYIGESKNIFYFIKLELEPIEDEGRIVNRFSDGSLQNFYRNYNVISTTCIKKK